MYADPRLIKKHEIKLRIDDDTNELVEALVKNTGGQKSVISRDIFLRGLKLACCSKQELTEILKNLTETL